MEIHFHNSVVTQLLKPGHVYPPRDWWKLFPRKLNTSYPYNFADGSDNTVATNGVNETWCIHIIEELHAFAVVWVCLWISVCSGVLGIICSVVTSDAGAGFTIAAFFGGTAALSVTCI